MPNWGWILIAVLALITIASAVLAVRATADSRRTTRLKEHYGSEYQRAVGETGDQRAAEKALLDRERDHQKLDIVALSPETQAKYGEYWHAVQSGFIDSPAAALADADRLITLVMRERGYPVDDFEQRAADISVDHPDVVDNYRTAHGIHLAQERGDIGTEQQREAFIHYRALFEKLVEENTAKEKQR
jgi:hypothetical protein